MISLNGLLNEGQISGTNNLGTCLPNVRTIIIERQALKGKHGLYVVDNNWQSENEKERYRSTPKIRSRQKLKNLINW